MKRALRVELYDAHTSLRLSGAMENGWESFFAERKLEHSLTYSALLVEERGDGSLSIKGTIEKRRAEVKFDKWDIDISYCGKYTIFWDLSKQDISQTR